MKTYLVTIQDKELFGEPDIGVCVVEALSEADARKHAQPWIDLLAYQGRGRCVAWARELTLGAFYRTLALLRPPVAQVIADENGPKEILW